MTRLSLRAGSLLAAGSLAVHELRYLVGYGGEGRVSGHGYLAWLAPLVALALAAACGAWLGRIGRDDGRRRPALTWLGASASLLLTYVVQETAEGLTAHDHPGLLAHGGWLAAPIALAVGGLIALALRGARAADRAAASAARPWSPLSATAVPSPVFFRLAAAPLVPRRRVLARRLAGRGPPLFS
jgi:hypothetical protein